ncbi:OmpA family protein [Porphyromonas cangingivalis]|uniref:Membrane protein n=1 Tax=Porphyromonas cangingivalis TaxID=36874 RepID=A0A099WWJ1_PORCN|nr:OmpA family protein [Porphyromonas cangingivalis]KGL48981.1 membrane protein [Porphyromonas cangingivalis]KGN82814.1 membrane protein [Porphyromonas cangingivalis]SJZ31312.1 Outer membrane protein OmpA [Porphyromonas cangingivalis]SPY35808.1 Inner membrane lipoprotein YiaD precursor [Porphyromonas cangingivalis]VEJ04400.1 Inner membrane lipoprotein YiaD precursor [Porphyromonas cangingivalis]
MKKTKTLLGVSFLSVAITLGGCGLNNAAKGTGIGAGAGAAIGAGIGNAMGNTGLGAVIGAAIGGAAGGVIGNKMDKQKKELEQAVPEATVETVNNGEAIRVTFDSGILFATNSSTLSAASRNALTRFAQNMNENPDTDIKIIGHTDSTGRHEYNMTLSKKRADSVFNHLITQGVRSSRILSIGMGPDQPVADNTTVEGRAQNRRVEVYILPNAKMIEEAKKQGK